MLRAKIKREQVKLRLLIISESRRRFGKSFSGEDAFPLHTEFGLHDTFFYHHCDGAITNISNCVGWDHMSKYETLPNEVVIVFFKLSQK